MLTGCIYSERVRRCCSVAASPVGEDENLALKATIEITNRTEGRPKQSIDMDMQDDNEEHIIRGFVIPTSPEDFIS